MQSTLPIILFVFLASVSNAQNNDPSAKEKKGPTTIDGGSVVLLNDTLQRYINMMDSIDSKELKTTGYRIQVYSSSGPNAKREALDTKSDFLKLYNDYPAYTLWNYPNWVVRLGDYRTRLQALEFHEEIREAYPASFIMKDEINVDY